MSFEIQRGTLYIVPTPIGNLADISERARQVLDKVSFIAAEDTRVSGKLLSFLGIKNNLVSYHEHNKEQSGKRIVERLLVGESCAIVTDAGTPAISDPGQELVSLCVSEGISVVPIPGACAFVTALSASGFCSRRFCFEGFLPSEKSHRNEIIQQYKTEKKTVIFYEAPHRLKQTIKELYDALGDRKICVAREITKLNEEIKQYTLGSFYEELQVNQARGEYVLIIEGAQIEEATFFENMSVEEHVGFYEKQGLSRMDAIKACARDRHVPKSAIYKEFL